MAWFTAHARDLPWRHPATTPWGVLVSEVMLQQTPARRVEPVFCAWMRRWPSPSGLAAANPGTVLRAWGTLGYPRRALRLQTAAGTIAAEHGDAVPADVDALLALPGVGAYTARAVAAFGYGRRVPVVDTNVRRVLARAVHARADPGPASTTRDLATADELLPTDGARAARFSAAVMELGATVCTARSPGCTHCPIADSCGWFRAGSPPGAGPVRPGQRFAGTDRQVRGLLLGLLRRRQAPLDRAELDLAWPDGGQRERCLHTLLADGLVEPTPDGRYALAGETDP